MHISAHSSGLARYVFGLGALAAQLASQSETNLVSRHGLLPAYWALPSTRGEYLEVMSCCHSLSLLAGTRLPSSGGTHFGLTFSSALAYANHNSHTKVFHTLPCVMTHCEGNTSSSQEMLDVLLVVLYRSDSLLWWLDLL